MPEFKLQCVIAGFQATTKRRQLKVVGFASLVLLTVLLLVLLGVFLGMSTYCTPSLSVSFCTRRFVFLHLRFFSALVIHILHELRLTTWRVDKRFV